VFLSASAAFRARNKLKQIIILVLNVMKSWWASVQVFHDSIPILTFH